MDLSDSINLNFPSELDQARRELLAELELADHNGDGKDDDQVTVCSDGQYGPMSTVKFPYVLGGETEVFVAPGESKRVTVGDSPNSDDLLNESWVGELVDTVTGTGKNVVNSESTTNNLDGQVASSQGSSSSSSSNMWAPRQAWQQRRNKRKKEEDCCCQ